MPDLPPEYDQVELFGAGSAGGVLMFSRVFIGWAHTQTVDAAICAWLLVLV